MSEDNISQAPAQDITSTDNGDQSQESPSVQVFDITPDLNIAPARDESENATAETLPDMIPKIEGSTEQKTENKDLKQNPAQQFGPANPPTKTIGMGIGTTPANQVLPQSNNQETLPNKPKTDLQTEISTINLPVNLKKDTLVPQPKISEKPWEAKFGSKIKPLKTYETDVAEAVAKKNISRASVVIAEKKKTEEQNTNLEIQSVPDGNNNMPLGSRGEINENEVKKNDPYQPKSHWIRSLLFIIICLAIMGGGLFIAYNLYLKSPVAPVINTQPNQNILTKEKKSVILADSKISINIDNKNLNNIITAVHDESSKPQEVGTIKEIILTKKVNGIDEPVLANELLSQTGLSVPDLISRSLSPNWMLGVYTDENNQKHNFIVTTNNFFQNTFAGMIQWEPTMAKDLEDFLYPSTNPESNSTSSPPISFTLRGQYKDKIIKNRDVREYVAENGHIILLYSFLSNDKLVITRGEEALSKIVDRLEKAI